MAEKTEKIERTYNVPLRHEWLKVPRYKRAKKAIVGLKKFLVKHMKSENVSIGKYANEAIWGRGMKSPPHHLKVTVIKQDGKVYAELFGKPIQMEKKEQKKTLAEKLGMKQKGSDDVQEAVVVEESATKATKEEKKESKPKKEKKAKEVVDAEVSE